MPITSLTGSESERFREIRDYWAVMSPSTTDKFANFCLYNVPNGQTFATEFIINSGSATFTSGTVEIVKNIHIFNSETAVSEFVNEIGASNIASISERERPVAVGGVFRLQKTTEIQLLDTSEISIDFDLVNGEIRRGFKIEVFASSSTGLKEVQRNPEFGADGGLISDTFLKYFEINEDV